MLLIVVLIMVQYFVIMIYILMIIVIKRIVVGLWMMEYMDMNVILSINSHYLWILLDRIKKIFFQYWIMKCILIITTPILQLCFVWQHKTLSILSLSLILHYSLSISTNSAHVPFVYCGGPNLLLKLPTFDNRSLNWPFLSSPSLILSSIRHKQAYNPFFPFCPFFSNIYSKYLILMIIPFADE